MISMLTYEKKEATNAASGFQIISGDLANQTALRMQATTALIRVSIFRHLTIEVSDGDEPPLTSRLHLS